MPTSDAALLTGIRLRNAERNLGLYGVHLHREGHEPVEHRFRNDDLVNVYSGSKAFTAVAVGMAQAEGLLDLDDPVLGFFPGQEHADGVEAMTVRHLLQMTSGNTFTWWGPGQEEQTDLLAGFLRSELVAEPGARFEYSNGCTYVLSRVVHAVSGQDLRDYLLPRLFDPLAIHNPQWMRCPLGFSRGATDLFLRTSEYARLGRLLLQEGRWEGEQLVPASYVHAMHTDVVETQGFTDTESQAGYGYQVWGCTPEGAWRADGMYGQFSVVLPQQRAVVTTTAHNEAASNDILRAVWDELLPLL
ncbi:serine hydrolase [Georgenia sp. 311]|uniref:Serine hydrolase n=1 Tax=Georgenia wutianyii TaxID=2585135 RepID=A0ABX5VL91_9MICO|nr:MULTISPECIES: serine hydrolase [Georgenia]QDB79246.1 serine hydrolase [Georgenia wutianyii]TNC18734.1 serine hydrolase [Georgenia sp. 311]